MAKRSKQDVELDSTLLWDYLHADGDKYTCELRAAFGWTYPKLRTMQRWLLKNTGNDVVLPTGQSRYPHINAHTGANCRCGLWQLNYDEDIARDWGHRRLVIVKGHAESVAEHLTQLHKQYQAVHLFTRLLDDADRLIKDVNWALENVEVV